MNRDAALAAHVIDLLADWGAVRARHMFGGTGLFSGARMIGLIFDGQPYLRADRITVDSEPERAFAYRRAGRWIRLPYLRVDATALEDSDSMHDLATAAWEAAGQRGTPSRGART